MWVLHTSRARVSISTPGWIEGQNTVEVMSTIDLMLVKKDILWNMQDVRAVRGMGQGLSDHRDVHCKVRSVGGWSR